MTETIEPQSERADLRVTSADRREFHLDKVQWAAFIAAFDAPRKDNPCLRKLLTRTAPWDPE
jgi:uncharacterized protein (DUF1778 family)